MYNNIQEELMVLNEPLGFFPKNGGIKPFLKWAGGKTQLLTELHKLIPLEYNKYIEPFIGGGAMFFSLNSEKSIISDSNEELINTYKQIRDNVENVIKILKTFENTESFYYDIRKKSTHLLDDDYRAARLIFLNKTCFNGLYRVNKQGLFNVPYGKGKSNFLNEIVLHDAHIYLQETEIFYADYLNTLNEFAEKGDFVFLDPPYYPIAKNSDFQRYTKEFFYHEDQVKLKNEFVRLVELGCKVLLTNSDHPFILEIYKDFEVKIIETKRMISSNSNTRLGKDIIVIGNYDR